MWRAVHGYRGKNMCFCIEMVDAVTVTLVYLFNLPDLEQLPTVYHLEWPKGSQLLRNTVRVCKPGVLLGRGIKTQRKGLEQTAEPRELALPHSTVCRLEIHSHQQTPTGRFAEVARFTRHLHLGVHDFIQVLRLLSRGRGAGMESGVRWGHMWVNSRQVRKRLVQAWGPNTSALVWLEDPLSLRYWCGFWRNTADSLPLCWKEEGRIAESANGPWPWVMDS